MKKIILFCLSACLLGMLLVACPQDQDISDTEQSITEQSSSSGSTSDNSSTSGTSSTSDSSSASGTSSTSDSSSASGTSSTSDSSSTSGTLIDAISVTFSKVSFNANGGSGVMAPKSIKATGSTLSSCEFTKEGYVFTGWNTAADGSGETFENKSVLAKTDSATGTVTLYAQWSPISYTIRFDSNGGSGLMDDIVLFYNEYHTLSNQFTAPAGKIFAYWSDNQNNPYLDGESVSKLTAENDSIATLYANWISENESAILYHNTKNAANQNPKMYTSSSNIVLENISCDGFTFLGWYDASGDISSGNKITSWTAGSKSGTVHLWAKWADGTIVEEPGTIEPLPAVVDVLRQARHQINPLENEVVFFYWREDGQYSAWSMWMWSTGGDGADNFDVISNHGFSTILVDNTADPSNPHKVGYMKFNTEGTSENDCIPLVGEELKVIQEKGKFNFIVRKKSGWTKDYEGDLFWELMEGNYFGQLSGNGNVYSIADGAKPQIMNAIMQDNNHLLIGLSQKYAVSPLPSSNGFTIESSEGDTLQIEDMYFSGLYGDPALDTYRAQFNFAKQFTICVGDGIDFTKEWYVKHSEFAPSAGLKVSLTSALKNNISEMEYTGDDLGLTLNGSTAGFKVFAPIASEANILLYADWNDAKADIDNVHDTQTTSDVLTNGGTRVAMTKAADFAETGIWQASDVDVSGKNYYVYEFKNVGTVYRVCDINALVAAPDSVAAQIIDINDSACQPAGWESSYTNPFGNSGSDTKTYTEAIIYEMHIRDWSKGLNSSNIGKFDEITEGLGENGNGVLGQHLKDLGITHVQILPMFDYAQKNDDDDYNWGYNPYHYNVPEGRYVNDNDNGGQEAVKQMRGMIKAFHDAGIAVNMDVVYNHTNGTSFGSLYDMTVPSYYYRLKNGAYSNGSGCGNETDSSMPMYRKYMIDSLSHWMRDYHINGFRFDLMGLHEAETMAAIYTALKDIDPNVMVYGEPWAGGDSPVKNSSTKAGAVGNAGYGAFDDAFRNAIKGGEYEGFEQGQVQGTFTDSAIITGLTGASTNRNTTGNPGLSIHYVECHDNYTLFDKLVYSTLSESVWKETGLTKEILLGYFDTAYQSITTDADKLTQIRKQNKLAAAFVLLAQGTPFMNGGQEFMRTKMGDENSYISDDEINAIDMTFKETYSDVYNVYKGLIALRKTYDAFTKGTNVAAEKIANGVTKYTVSGTNGDFCVYFNATANAVEINTTGYDTVIDVTDGTLNESTTLPTTVGATNFVILKK